MTDDVRQKVRDYARGELALHEDNVGGSFSVEYETYVNVGQRGELTPLAFVALQNVLDALANVEHNGYSHIPNQVILDAIAKAFE